MLEAACYGAGPGRSARDPPSGLCVVESLQRAAMMQANEDYWREHGTPTAVVARVLHAALLRMS